MVENSTLCRQCFTVFLRELFCYNKIHFLMNKTYYKNCFLRGSRPELFCKQRVQKQNYVIFAGKHLRRSLFHVFVLQVVPSEEAIYK